jgi:RNA polymerase sigma factor (sigma-70 family)
VSGDDDLRSDDAARAADRALHARLLSGNDPTASSDLFLHYLEPVHAYLRRAFPQTDEADTFDVATDLLLALPKHPERYDPDRSSLLAYLKMAVRGDLLNRLRTISRQRRTVLSLEDVALRAGWRNRMVQAASDPADTLADAEMNRQVRWLCEQFEGLDREVVELMATGERRTERYAVILRLTDQPPSVQRREVKRIKDRQRKKMQRRWRQLETER